MLTKKQWQRKQRRKKYLMLITVTTLTMLIILSVIMMSVTVVKNINKPFNSVLGFIQASKPIAKPEISEMLLTPNDYSRPQTP